MVPVGGGDSVTIGRLRAHVAGRHASRAAQARLRLAYHMQSATLTPPTMPPSGILVVRRVGDAPPAVPRPVRMRRATTWERAARDEVSAAYRRAARPLVGLDADGAAAVYFGDEAELLACFALDVAAGRAATRWWWRSLWPTAHAAQASGLVPLLGRHARVLPAVLQRLVDAQAAAAVLDCLSAKEALALAHALVRAYGLPGVVEMAPRADVRGSSAGSSASRAPRGPRPDAAAAAPLAAHTPAAAARHGRPAPPASVHPPGREQAIPRLRSPVHEYLLGLGLTVYRSPSVARESGFQRSLRAWWAAASQPHRDSPGLHGANPPPGDLAGTPDALPKPDALPAADTLSGPAHDPRSFAAHAAAPHMPTATAQAETRGVLEPGPLPRARPLEDDRHAATSPVHAGKAPAAQGDGPAILDMPPGAAEGAHASGRAAPGIPPADTAQDSAALPATRAPWVLRLEGGVDTDLAGVFYLVNVLCRLGLPACFAQGWHLGRDLGAWGVLELLARGLLSLYGPPDAAGTDDPVWAAMATLAGREVGSLPARRSRGRPLYRAPRAWLRGLDSAATFFYSSRGGRLCVWSQDGVVIAECARRAVPASAQARTELRRAGLASPVPLRRAAHRSAPLAAPESAWTAGLQPGLMRWLACVMPTVERLLRRGPGMDAPDALWTLMGVRGRLYVTTTHVDVVMGLDDISLGARLAGLDRDPGWLPEFGRVILFHFDE